MTDKEYVFEVFRRFARSEAEVLQANAPDMTPDEIIDNEIFIPEFNPQRQYLNFTPGYICKTPSGNVVKLLQAYDSSIYTQDPEELPAQWGFYWSTDPKKAKPFIALSTSPYYKDSCCLLGDEVYRSLVDNNVWSPSDYAQGWTKLGPIEEALQE